MISATETIQDDSTTLYTSTEASHERSTQLSTKHNAANVDKFGRSYEYYGPSSSVAFLTHIDTLSRSRTISDIDDQPVLEEPSTPQLLHRGVHLAASHQVPPKHETPANPENFFFRGARRFLDTYFSTMHNVAPIFDQEFFLIRCEDLWFGRQANQPTTFVALYYATLGVGCLLTLADEHGTVGGEGRFVWSRTLFDLSVATMNAMGMTSDLETVQCFYMLVSY